MFHRPQSNLTTTMNVYVKTINPDTKAAIQLPKHVYATFMQQTTPIVGIGNP